MRSLIVTALIASSFVFASAIAQTTSTQSNAHPAYSTAETDLGTLLDDPAARAVLEKHVPSLVNNGQIEMARSMTLKGLQQYAADTVTDAALAAIDADLAKLAKKK
jgi:para-nitrobenzyl esterase